MNESKTAQYRDRVQRLQSELLKVKKDAGDEKCLPMMLIAAAIVPIATFLATYFLSPRFVMSGEGAKKTRSTTKVFIWTSVITVVIWAGMYAWSLYQGTDASICART